MVRSTLVIVTVALGMATAHAQAPAPPAPPEVVSYSDTALRPGHLRTYKLDRSFTTVVVGNPAVIDATVTADRLLTVQAKQVGATNVALYDPNGELIYDIRLQVAEEPIEPKPRLRGTMVIHNKPLLQEYWTYACTPTGCRRVADAFEGAPPPIPQPPTVIEHRGLGTAPSGQTQRESTTVRDGPGGRSQSTTTTTGTPVR